MSSTNRGAVRKGAPRTAVHGHERWLEFARAALERLWSKTRPSGACIVWIGAVDKDGYGKIMIHGGYIDGHQVQKTMRPHRMIWELAHGPVPDGLLVLHSCDNPPCCNLAHLSIGTQLENRRQAKERGRTYHPDLRGEKHNQVKLTDEHVRQLRALRGVETGPVAASRFGVSKHTVYAIWRGVARRSA